MENSSEIEKGSGMEPYSLDTGDFSPNTQDIQLHQKEFQGTNNSTRTTSKTLVGQNEGLSENPLNESNFKKVDDSGPCIVALSEVLEDSRSYQEGDERATDNRSVEVEIDNMSETLSEKMAQLDSVLKTSHSGNSSLNACEGKENSTNHVKKLIGLPEAFTDSSLSSSSEPQSTAAPFESSSSSQENNANINTVDFKNSIESQIMWKERSSVTASGMEIKMDVEPITAALEQPEKVAFPSIDVPVIKTEEKANISLPAEVVSSNGLDNGCFLVPGFPPSALPDQQCMKDNEREVKMETAPQEPTPEPTPLPIIPPAPRKRGRPRKQVLPNPSPLVESWGPNAQEFPLLEPPKEEPKRPSRSERRQIKKKKIEDVEPGDENLTKKRKTPQTYQKKKRRSTYVPKKKLPSAKKKQSEIENFQNFEEETRMSASEGPTGFTAKSGKQFSVKTFRKKSLAHTEGQFLLASGATGDESQGSSAADGPTRSNINKKGRMEVGTDGCKPVTVQQIVEYYWPPSSQGEKPEALMIQEQITEYLGVKSFKRKYPSIKRRPVDMEERNYLQENGFVSENMCDMGLTAVFAADIIEIMYNDFPQKFEEYRKFTREKKAKEQRALREKQAAERADVDPKKEAMESALSWNTDFNKTRREKRASCFDLQTFTVHFPTSRFKRISLGKPGHYPVALIPGQNTDYYKSYTSNELKYFPLNTVLYGPLRPNERHLPIPSGSDGSQSEIDDSSSSDESSSSSSEETQDTEETNSTVEEETGADAAEMKVEKSADFDEKEPPKAVKNFAKTPKGRGRGKANNVEQKTEPKKRLGRPPKLKLASIKLKRVDGDMVEALKEEKVDISTRIIIHTCKMCHEEESKNKNGEFESFIECAQCKGKIHPSCIDLTADMIPKISSYGWQCTDCKSCVKCGQSSSEDKMIFCDQCDRGYHIFCVGLSEVPSGNYICMVCKPNTTPEEPMRAPENNAAESEIKEEPSETKEEIKVQEESPEKSNF